MNRSNKEILRKIREAKNYTYEEILRIAMSQETKKTIKEASEFFKKVQEGADKYKSIPDKQLTEKIRKVGDGAGEIVKHITEHTDH